MKHHMNWAIVLMGRYGIVQACPGEHAFLHARLAHVGNCTHATTVPATKTAITNVRVFDGTGMTGPQTIIISDSKIEQSCHASDLGDMSIIDGTNQFLIPGLIESHAHPQSCDHLKELAAYGVTTVLNMACPDYNLCRSLRGQHGVTDFISAGWPVIASNAPGPLANLTSQAPFHADDDPARIVELDTSNGADFIKVRSEPGGPTQSQLTNIVTAAHDIGMQVMMHAADINAYNMAILSGADGIQHVPTDGLLDAKMVDQMTRQHQFATPTMTIFKMVLANPVALEALGRSGTKSSWDNVVGSVRLLHRAGVPITAGTDAVDGALGLSIPFGRTLHCELEFLVEAGIHPAEALRGATTLAAELHRLADRGVVKPGHRADLLLLNSNPLEDIVNTRDIARAWVGGIEVEGLKTGNPFLCSFGA
jgi:imidazolonepropionase-like amidohydrolase